MLRGRSIRFRLTLWYAAVLTAGLALFGGLTWLLLRDRMMAEIDRGLESRVSQFESFFRTEAREGDEAQLRDELGEFCQAMPAASYLQVHGSNGFSFRCSSNSSNSALLQGELRTIRTQFTAGGETFDVEGVAAATDAVHTLGLLRVLLLSLLPIVIAGACIGGFWLSGRALQPVNDIAAAALSISIENLSERVPVPATGDDLAKLAEVLNTMLARLDAAVTTLSQFVADASHELRTPLAVIRTSAELALRKDRSADSYRASLQQVVSEAGRMTELVENLLTLARADAAVDPLPMAAVDLREVVRAACTEMEGVATERQVRIVTRLGLDDDVAWVAGNRAALQRAFEALLDNAVKFSSPGGDIQVNVGPQSAGWSVIVHDSGPGIAVQDLPHIFKRFYRADRSRTTLGYGLGLALVESVLKAHGATIEAASDRGARFTLRFAALSLEPAPNSEPMAGRSPVIL